MEQHNPITVRLDQMAGVWKNKVQPHHTLVRWSLQPEDSRMYEGFCRLEASPHGKLDNLFVFFYTPFEREETYSCALMENWLQELQDEQQLKALRAAGITREWDTSLFARAVQEKDYALCDELLPLMIGSYREWIGMPKHPFVISLLPKSMSSPRRFQQWMQQWMEQARPPFVQLLVFDHKQGNHWGKVFEQYSEQAVTLHHHLNMQEAIRQIATNGAATDPHAFFRKCMFHMGDAIAAKDKAAFDAWSAKAIEAAKKSGDKVLLATAYITVAGMLFNNREHAAIDQWLDTGMRLCKQEIAAGQDAFKPLLLQYYIYKGAHYQIQKQKKQALEWFLKAGDQAAAYGLAAQAVSAYYKAYIFADHKSNDQGATEASTLAMQLTPHLSIEEVQSSEYPFMAQHYLQQKKGQQTVVAEAVEAKMQQAFGKQWQTVVTDMKKNYTKKKIRQAEAAA